VEGQVLDPDDPLSSVWDVRLLGEHEGQVYDLDFRFTTSVPGSRLALALDNAIVEGGSGFPLAILLMEYQHRMDERIRRGTKDE
jgi:hypothetical protein